MINHLSVLHIDINATTAQLRTAYLLAARQTHPDSGGSVAAFAEVKQAYETLRDPARRSQWLTQYRAHYAQADFAVCEKCLQATKRGGSLCGCTPKVQSQTARLSEDLSAQLGDFLIRVSCRVGDEFADRTLAAVDRGLAALNARLGRRKT